MDKNSEKITKKIDETNKLLADFVSYKKTFIRGILAGIGTAIGATIIAGVLIFGISRILRSIEIPALQEIILQIQESGGRRGN